MPTFPVLATFRRAGEIYNNQNVTPGTLPYRQVGTSQRSETRFGDTASTAGAGEEGSGEDGIQKQNPRIEVLMGIREDAELRFGLWLRSGALRGRFGGI